MSGGSTTRATTVGTLSRSVPIGLSRKLLTASSAAPTSPSAGVSRSQQPRAGLGQRDAAGGAVEQAHAEPRFQPPQRLAQRRGRDAAQGRGAAEAAGARHGGEGVEVGEVGRRLIVRNSVQLVRLWPDYRTRPTARI